MLVVSLKKDLPEEALEYIRFDFSIDSNVKRMSYHENKLILSYSCPERNKRYKLNEHQSNLT